MSEKSTAPLLATEGVRKQYGRTTALDSVSIVVRRGRSVGIAGESGSGKSTLLGLLLALEDPTSGEVLHKGRPVSSLGRDGLRSLRREVQPVMQDTLSCFNPRQRVRDALLEPARHLLDLSSDEYRALAKNLVQAVGLLPEHLDRFPHQLSGGQRQRVAIARSLSCRPEVVLLDEPVTALDVSIRGNILNLFRDEAERYGLTYVVVSHDLLSIYYLTDYVYIMRYGQVVEEGPTVDVIDYPSHPYTQLLVRSVEDPLYNPNEEQALV